MESPKRMGGKTGIALTRERISVKVLVTGGTGFIGSRIAKKVRDEGHEVTIFDINTRDGIINGIQHIKGDIFDSKHISEVLKDLDYVIHMIGLPNARKAQERPQLSYDLKDSLLGLGFTKT